MPATLNDPSAPPPELAAALAWLASRGLLPDQRVSGASLEEDVECYRRHLEAKGNKPRSTADALRMIRWLLAGARSLREVTTAAIIDRLGELRRLGRNGRAGRTVNAYRTAAHGLFRWACLDQRISRNPVAFVPRTKEFPRRKRRALSPEEVQELLAGMRGDPDRHGLSWELRQGLYIVALETGLREKAIASLTPESFHLDEFPYIHVDAAFTKGGKEENPPLRPQTAAFLRPLVERTPAGQAVFPILRPHWWSRMLRQDMRFVLGLLVEQARRGLRPMPPADFLQPETPEGVVNFHALKHTSCTWMDDGAASLAVIARHGGHTSVGTTLGHYLHVQRAEDRKALDRFPDLAGPAGLSVVRLRVGG